MKFIVTIHPNGYLALRPDHTEYKSLGPMTPEEAVAFKAHVHDHGQQPHCTLMVGPISKVKLYGRDWRRAGKTQTWKTRPGQYRIPLMYAPHHQGNEITPETTGYFHRAEDCPLVWLRENVGFDRKRIVQAIKDAVEKAKAPNLGGLFAPFDIKLTAKEGLPVGDWTLDLEALPDKKEGQRELVRQLAEQGITASVEREVPEVLRGERGPATLDDTFLAPGRPELDARSQFVKIYAARGEHGAGPTEDYFDLYADTGAGEIVRKDVISTGVGLFGTLWRIIAEKARHVLSTNDPFLRAECLAEIDRILDSGYVIDFDALRKRTVLELWAEGIVTHSASSRLDFANDVLFHLEQQAQNNYGADKPPFKVAHLTFTSRDVPFKISLCGAGWSADCPLPYLQAARFKRFGAPPFTPVCLACCGVLAQMGEKDLNAKVEQAQEQAQGCNCEQMRALVRASAFDLEGEKLVAGDARPVWICPVHGEVKDELSVTQDAWAHSARAHDQNKRWFYDVAKSCSAALADKDADEWASAMATAETVMLNAARDPNSDFVIEYDDLINVVTVEERKGGRMAALDPAQADAWTSVIVRDDLREQVETRKRVLLALCFDKFLNNPDCEAHIPAPDLEEAERIKRAEEAEWRNRNEPGIVKK